MTEGTVKRIVRDKAFGFIKASDGSEYFFHRSDCDGEAFDGWQEGQRVAFEAGQGPKGPRASRVEAV